MGTERVVHKSEYGSRANCCCRRHARGQKEKAGKARQAWGLHRGCCDDKKKPHRWLPRTSASISPLALLHLTYHRRRIDSCIFHE